MTIALSADRRAVPAPGTARPGAVRAGLGFSYAGALTMPWTGVRLGGLSLGDGFLLLAAIALVAADLTRPWPKLPWWVWAFEATVIATGLVNQLDPPSLHYMVSRDLLYNNYMVVHAETSMIANLTVMVPLAVRIVLIPFVFSLAREYEPRAPYRVIAAFVMGVAFDAAVAFTDSRGITSIGPQLTKIPVEAGRAAGLTQHPNVVAMTCVFALPLVVWQLRAPRTRTRWFAVAALALVLLGLYASRSRSGAPAAAVATLLTLAWLPQYRRFLPTLGLLFGLVGGALFVAHPGAGTALLKGLRVAGGGSDTAGSDQARTIVNDQAMRDFQQSPVHGIGLEVAEQAHNVYLQALAVGGVILLAGLLAFLVGALGRCVRLAKEQPLAIPLFASVLGGAIFNAAQNALTPALVYLMAGLVAALPLAASREEGVA